MAIIALKNIKNKEKKPTQQTNEELAITGGEKNKISCSHSKSLRLKYSECLT